MTPDPHAELRDKVLGRVLRGPGESAQSVREAAAEGRAGAADLQTLVDKIHRHAYKVTDEDIARLQPRYPEDELFEIVVSAALGASARRLMAGLQALDDA